MSRYTTQFRYLLENPEWTDERLGLSDYPIFDESYRNYLNEKIKNNFYFDEIGFETPARFAHRMKNRLAVIMPYYNQLYLSAKAEINPFITKQHSVNTVSTLQEILNIIKNQTGDTSKDGNVESSEATSGSSNSTTVSATDSFGADKESNVSSTNSSSNASKTSDNTVNVTDTKQELTNHDDEKTGTKTNDGLSVTSDTPEGFLSTNSIGHNTYANSATKNTDSSNYQDNDSSTTSKNETGTKRDISNYEERGTNEGNAQSATLDAKNSETNSGSTAVQSAVTTSDKVGTINSTDVIRDIISAIENHVKNMDSESTSSYYGFDGITMSEMLTKWRSTFLNIDAMILNDLEDLFMLVLN